jgi:hypothetical protein
MYPICLLSLFVGLTACSLLTDTEGPARAEVEDESPATPIDFEPESEVVGEVGGEVCSIGFLLENDDVGEVPVGQPLTVPRMRIRSTCTHPVVLEMPEVLYTADGEQHVQQMQIEVPPAQGANEPFVGSVSPVIKVDEEGPFRFECRPAGLVDKALSWRGEAVAAP